VFINLYAPSGVFSFGVIMRKFMVFMALLCSFMAGMSVGFGLMGKIDLVDTLVFAGAFIGLIFLIDWEIRHFECMD
jgi:hypothetical protein